MGLVLAGKYKLIEQLGEGGMGVVYAALHRDLGHRVAVKVLRLVFASDSYLLARFREEARALARLESPNIVSAIDLGETPDGRPFFVMEFLKGTDLDTLRRKRGRLPVEEVIAYVLQAMEGVAAAHAEGLVHLDLKPANIFLHRPSSGAPTIKVLDFGLAQLARGGGAREAQLVGSPLYMSPERLCFGEVGIPSDIWSLGIVLWELIVGSTPWKRDSSAGYLSAAMRDPPLPIADPVFIPKALEEVLLRCLAKEPRDRFSSLGELAHALEPFGASNASELAGRVQRRLESRPPLSSIPPFHSVPTVPPSALLEGHRDSVYASGSGRIKPLSASDPSALEETLTSLQSPADLEPPESSGPPSPLHEALESFSVGAELASLLAAAAGLRSYSPPIEEGPSRPSVAPARASTRPSRLAPPPVPPEARASHVAVKNAKAPRTRGRVFRKSAGERK